MLVEAAGLGAEDDVVLDEEIARALVGIDAPAAVAVGLDVVDEVVAQLPAGLDRESVDAAHVGEEALAEVVDVVMLDDVAHALARAVTPYPADGDTGVIEVVDLVVRDEVGAGVANEHADGRVVDVAAIADLAVGDAGADGVVPDLHATGAEVDDAAT